MCGIAGLYDLKAERSVPAPTLACMGQALIRRGPDQSGTHRQPGLGLVSQRLSIVGLNNGRQPLYNEDGSVVVVCNGEFFDFRQVRAQLQSRGHQFRTESDCEILVHLWEDHGEQFFPHLKGQFAFALFDQRRKILILARDRMGICPLHFARQDDWLLFGSEIKALLASQRIKPQVDRRALDHVFSFLGMSTRRTMFEGVSSLLPGTYLKVEAGEIQEYRYWDLDFPDRGQERQDPSLAAELEELLIRAVDLRLGADVPVVSYLSGGVDSSLVAALASRQLNSPIPTFSIRIPEPGLNEIPRALLTARHIGSHPLILDCGAQEISHTYPALVIASECPVIDTSSAAIYSLAGAVHEAGFKVVLSGEGADEALAGYPWFKVGRLLALLDRLGVGLPLRKFYYSRANRRGLDWSAFERRFEEMGGSHASSHLYAAASLSGYRVYSEDQLDCVRQHGATGDLQLDLNRMQRWHPLNRALYLNYKVLLAGLLMTHKGDRPAMANSVEARFPFLDDEVVQFCARLDPELKLKGWFRDKHLLREVAQKYLPRPVADRPKHIFRAAYAGSFLTPQETYVEQLLSPESLAKTDYFDPARVARCRRRLSNRSPDPLARLSPRMQDEMALVGVISTQLWHHLFLGGQLCELPGWQPGA